MPEVEQTNHRNSVDSNGHLVFLQNDHLKCLRNLSFFLVSNQIEHSSNSTRSANWLIIVIVVRVGFTEKLRVESSMIGHVIDGVCLAVW